MGINRCPCFTRKRCLYTCSLPRSAVTIMSKSNLDDVMDAEMQLTGAETYKTRPEHFIYTIN
jgi:hypothetical protein